MLPQLPVAIATITLARTQAEQATMEASLQQLAQLGLPILVSDGGSPPSFLRFLQGLPCTQVLPAKGLWGQAWSSLSAAAVQAPFVLYTEPDKHDFFTQGLPALLQSFQPNENTGVVLAARSEKAFASFPPFQQQTEEGINFCCAEVLGAKYDFVYGPFLLNSRVVPHLQKLPATIGWGWRPFAFKTARQMGLTLSAHTGDYFCPGDQLAEDATARLYRIKQMQQNLEGLMWEGGK